MSSKLRDFLVCSKLREVILCISAFLFGLTSIVGTGRCLGTRGLDLVGGTGDSSKERSLLSTPLSAVVLPLLTLPLETLCSAKSNLG